ncbi:MAG TPA: carbamate kinase [candidate division Zixibacteria bacterium]|nr:carbamate kinase [candidate division Zixibacteria bacterium]
MNKKLVAIALGGNMILQKGQPKTYEQQMENLRVATDVILKIIEMGYGVILTHGNGPQVGNILVQQKSGVRDGIPEQPLNICGAMSQGQIGFMIQTALEERLYEHGLTKKRVVVIITRAVVDHKDSAFKEPTKPIGPFYSEQEAIELHNKTKDTYINDAGRGFRKVVPSPIPLEILEGDTIRRCVEAGDIVISVGGGGIPVARENGTFIDVEAVIDKDRATEVLATQIDADILMILTDVSNAYINFRKGNQEKIEKISIQDMEKILDEGQFSKGSMKPKVESAINFIKNGGQLSIITSPEQAIKALKDQAGTRITK